MVGLIKTFGVLLIFLMGFSPSPLRAAEIWVSPQGCDSAVGTREHPLRSLQYAFRRVRELKRLHRLLPVENITIYMMDGQYDQREPIRLFPEDAGDAQHPTYVVNAPGAHPIISGGMRVLGWHKLKGLPASFPSAAKGKLWVAPIPFTGGYPLLFRELWVNGKKAVHAVNTNGNLPFRIRHVDPINRLIWVPDSALCGVIHPEGVEMIIHQMWAIANLRVKSMMHRGDSVALQFIEPESRIEFEHPWPSPVERGTNGSSAFFLVGAPQFLDQPGEWIVDYRAGQIYYWPRKGENMDKDTLCIPVAENLLRITGTETNPVQYINFIGIDFRYTTWLRPSLEGHVPIQAGMYLLDGYKLRPHGTDSKKGLDNQAWIGRPASAVTLDWTNHIGFEQCSFSRMASCALDWITGCQDNNVKRSLFYDIGGNGIQGGSFGEQALECHIPLTQALSQEICMRDTINNCLFRSCTTEDWGCVGIALGYVEGNVVSHNEISEVSYSGISLGWGWSKAWTCMHDNLIKGNYIYRYATHMYDVAGIYTLSVQPGTIIEENRVERIGYSPYVHDPDHWFYLYLDEGSSFITVRNNWIPDSTRILANANGPGNTWLNNGPEVKDTIKYAAGIESPYRKELIEKLKDEER